MFNRQEASQLRKKFWISFGQYMRPVAGATGNQVNWLNYKTGIRHIYFRMDVSASAASIAIELQHPDASMQQHSFEQLQQLKAMLEQTTSEEWNWQLNKPDEDGNTVSSISKTIKGVNIYTKADWPAIISFLKPRMIALDNFWMKAKDGFD